MLPGGLLDHAGFDDQEGKMTTNTRATAPRGAARRVPGERALRRKIIELCREMNATGLNQGTSGNISARDDDCMLITPSGIPYGTMKPEMIARMPVDDDTGAWEGPCRPSSEWHFHRAILRGNDDFGAVVHTHSTFATVLSMSRTTIPACHYMIAAFGGSDVRCADYATYGTAELSDNIMRAMKDRSACLMANHGMVAAGADLDEAMWAAVELETLSRQYYHARMAGTLNILPDEEVAVVLDKFRDYGLQAQQRA